MKFLLLISLCLFHFMKTIRNETRIKKENENESKTRIKNENENENETRTISKNGTQTGALDEIKAAQIVTNKLLQDYLNKTDTLLRQLVAKEGQVTTAKVCTGEDTNKLLKENNQLLDEIKKQGEDKTFENTTDVEKQLNESATEEGSIHLFSQKVRYPQDAYGFFSLDKNYNKNEPPLKNTSVNVLLEPTFLTKLESKTRKMGLEIHFILMWEEHEKRVNWTLKEKMKKGSFFLFSPSILE